MSIKYSKAFEKKFSTYDKSLQSKIYKAIQKLPDGDVKKMISNKTPPIFRLRVGKYRILFSKNSKTTYILKVDSRGDVYK